MPSLLSVNVGLPKNVAWQGRNVYTGIWKSPVDGPRLVRRLNIDGDGQGDLNGHGGEQRAVLAYQVESYRHWEEHFGRDLEYGAFGENFTVDGLSDDEVCIGDRYRIGEAEFEVTQPRVTCFRVGMRLGEPQMPALLVAHHRPGFYLRVITEGHVQAGDEIVRTRVGRQALSVADIDALLYLPGRDIEQLRAAVDIPALSPGWQQSFRELLDSTENGTHAGRATGRDRAGLGGLSPIARRRHRRRNPDGDARCTCAENGDALPQPQAGPVPQPRAAGAGEPPPVRSYSLSSAPRRRRLPDQRQTRTARHRQHLPARPSASRSILDVAAPRGEFVLTSDTNPVLLVSAGIGVTPVLAMLHQLAAAKQHPRRVVDPHRPRRERARLRRRGTPAAAVTAARPRTHLLHLGQSRPAAHHTGHQRTADAGRTRGPRPAGRLHRLHLRPGRRS